MQYDITVTRDGRWWMIEVPELDLLTQARRVDEVAEQARSLISIALDLAPSEVVLGNVHYAVDDHDISNVVSGVEQARAAAREAEEQAQKQTRAAVDQLVKSGVPLRDIGSLLQLSYQRVGQIANS